MMKRSLEELFEFEKLNGYLKINYLVDEFSLDEAISIVEYRKKITLNKPCYVLANISNIRRFSKEVKNYFANEGAENILGSAFCLKSLSSRIAFNIFIFLSHPKVEIKAFDNCQNADLWLQTLIKEHAISPP